MQNAKNKGRQIGRKPTTKDDIPQAFYKHYPMYKEGKISKKEYARLCGLSYPTIYKYLSIVG
jgi:DNA invertase Pin-like site-specific DNA recombinase